MEISITTIGIFFLFMLSNLLSTLLGAYVAWRCKEGKNIIRIPVIEENALHSNKKQMELNEETGGYDI